ncbi:MAG: hypothetical protein WAO71_12640 [Gallionella sp.]
MRLIFIATVPVLLFWGLDAYFLRLERLYRKLYEDVRKREEVTAVIDFSLNFAPYSTPENNWSKVALSQTLIAFYGVLFAMVIALVFLLKLQ